jgi:prevent-host-death family protein
MTEVASRELRNQTRALLDRVEAGERITITVDGKPVATLEPVHSRPEWVGRDQFVRRIIRRQADAGLKADLATLGSETTDDLPLS